MLKKDGKLVGIYYYAKEETCEVLEPLILPGYETVFWDSISGLSENPVKVLACPEVLEPCARSVERKPMIMVRILHLETLLSVLTVKEGESLSCSFAVIDPILTGNSRIWKLCSQEDGRIQVTETEDSQGVLTIGALTELVFGYRSAADLRKDPDVCLGRELQCELEKISPLSPVFLNEIV